MAKSVLHVGCGTDPLPEWLSGFIETRLDINPDANPHIVASMLDMGNIGEFDAVLCQHALEHLYPHEVSNALNEFRRVLKPGGHVIVFVPDLQDVGPTEEVLLQSPAGPITGIDMIYGYRPALASNPHMQHKTGFVAETLAKAMVMFSKVKIERLGNYNLMGAAVK